MGFNNICVHGKWYDRDKIKWKGHDTGSLIIWKCSANSMKELYEKLVDMDVISIVDYNPWERAVMEKAGRKEEDFYDEDNNYTFYEWYERTCGKYDLTEDEYEALIIEEKGNAYYQEIYTEQN